MPVMHSVVHNLRGVAEAADGELKAGGKPGTKLGDCGDQLRKCFSVALQAPGARGGVAGGCLHGLWLLLERQAVRLAQVAPGLQGSGSAPGHPNPNPLSCAPSQATRPRSWRHWTWSMCPSRRISNSIPCGCARTSPERWAWDLGGWRRGGGRCARRWSGIWDRQSARLEASHACSAVPTPSPPKLLRPGKLGFPALSSTGLIAAVCAL